MSNRYYDDERGEDFTPTSANIICDDMQTLAIIKRVFLDLLQRIEKHVGKPSESHGISDAEIAEESFDELLTIAWSKLERAYDEALDADDYEKPKYPTLERKP